MQASQVSSAQKEDGAAGCGAPVPLDEVERLEALRLLHILDTDPSERFDRIVRMAGKRFLTPVCRLTFVDAERVWFKSRFGMTAAQAPRDISICAHAIMSPEVLVVPDLAADGRFKASPQVAGGPRFRFYAGAPITVGGGFRVGSLCLMDYCARPDFSDEDAADLADMAQIVADELELHRQVASGRRELEKLDGELALAKSAKERFLWIVSHELRTPLNAITGFGKALRDGSANSAGAAEYAGYILQASERLTGLINRVLKYASADVGALQLSETEFPIEPAVRQAIGAALAEAGQPGRRVDVTARPSAPARLFADEVHVIEMIVQLVHNAVAHSGPNAAIGVTIEAGPLGQLVVSVSDSGPGIAVDQIELALAAFTQGEQGLTRSVGGLGLGLPITRVLAELHGGRLDIDASAEGGARVMITFPAHRSR